MPIIKCRECKYPSCEGCNTYTLERALEAGKFDWTMDETEAVHVPEPPPEVAPRGWKRLSLSPSDCKNALELIELYIFRAFHDFYEAGDFDNVEYLRSMVRVIDELRRVAEEADST